MRQPRQSLKLGESIANKKMSAIVYIYINDLILGVNIALFPEQLVYILAMTEIMDLENLMLVICFVDNSVWLCF